MGESVEVFRDLYLRGSMARRPDLREALIATAKDPWHFDTARSAVISRHAKGADILAFNRTETNTLRAAGLTLWSRDDGYFVPNIVPVGLGELGIEQYNAILADFIDRVVRPVAPHFGYEIDATEARQDLEDWTSAEAARTLRVFSAAANKSTAASHAMDRRRWSDFVIAVHQSQKVIGTDHLIRWLHAIEGWDEDSAEALAGQYEAGLSLLQQYDAH